MLFLAQFSQRKNKRKIIMNRTEYLESLDLDDIYYIIKYGLRNVNAPSDVTVEDIFIVAGCFYNSKI